MKSLLIAVCALPMAVSAAFACPDLTGTYVCPASQNSPSHTNVVTQSESNGVVTYTTVVTDSSGNKNTDTAVADGQPHNVTQPDGSTQVETVTCDGDSALKMDLTQSSPYGKMEAVATVTLDASKNFTMTANMTMNGQPMGTAETVTCTRQ